MGAATLDGRPTPSISASRRQYAGFFHLIHFRAPALATPELSAR
jgi:hypothetical protein